MGVEPLRVVALLFVPVLFTGCYTYSPIELATATPGMEVRARVSGGDCRSTRSLARHERRASAQWVGGG